MKFKNVLIPSTLLITITCFFLLAFNSPQESKGYASVNFLEGTYMKIMITYENGQTEVLEMNKGAKMTSIEERNKLKVKVLNDMKSKGYSLVSGDRYFLWFEK